eukprot:gene36697-41535_t
MNFSTSLFRRVTQGALALLAGLSFSIGAQAQELIIGEGIAAGWGQFFVADQQKLWEKEGLQPKVVTFASGRLVLFRFHGGLAVDGADCLVLPDAARHAQDFHVHLQLVAGTDGALETRAVDADEVDHRILVRLDAHGLERQQRTRFTKSVKVLPVALRKKRLK